METGTFALIIGAFAAVVSALVAVILMFLQLRQQNKVIQGQNRLQLRKQSDFERDWNGEEARPGVPERLGVMQRLERIEGELKPNGGGSLRDAVNRMEREQVRQRGQLTEHIDDHKGRGTTP